MNFKNILVSSAVLCLAASCNNSDMSKNDNSDSPDNIDKTITMASLLNNDDCFDARMERWFIRFNELQDKGYLMENANKEAIATVTVELKTCDGKPAIHVAQDESAEE